ncbi:MAG: asparagine--tRNA ligase [Fimbriimonas ginsengisoli]|uniref:Asparagine--tRNA ligase n=1 Tax=Fimbriimonas ginsengisoli TaxID=1005039 RepID=A0A931LS20_FIMGI|nr:asparagine--tRNA ligase [Fimbriimonas ginsengisoli]
MDYRRTYVRDLLSLKPGAKTAAFGWVKTRRDSKGISFVQLSDGSGQKDLQVVIPEGSIPDTISSQLTTGACVRFDGEIVESPAAGQPVELRADGCEVYGPADPAAYPLQKKGASWEFLREIAHLRPRGNTFGAVFRLRNAAAFAIHEFFQSRGFLYVQTPIITASDAEGAGALFAVSTLLEAHGQGYKLQSPDPAQDFFGKPAYLTVSGQLEAECLALALTNVYTFGPTFRAENSNSSRHLAEFWMIEPEMAFCDLEGNMNLAEEFVREVIGKLLERCGPDLDFFNLRIEPELLATLRHVVESPFERLPYTEAIKMLEASGEAFEYSVHWGCDLQSEHERWLTEKKVGRPVILTDYPKEIKAFYMRANDDGKTVRAMDVLAPRIGEIVGGSQREERLDKIEARITEMGLPMEAYGWYLDLRRFGSAPHSGFGLGFERLMMYVTGMKNIRDVIPFYRTPGSAEF